MARRRQYHFYSPEVSGNTGKNSEEILRDQESMTSKIENLSPDEAARSKAAIQAIRDARSRGEPTYFYANATPIPGTREVFDRSGQRIGGDAPLPSSEIDSALNTWDWRSAINAPTTGASTKSQTGFDKKMSDLDSILEGVLHGDQPQEVRVITSHDIAAAANSGHSPAAQERLFDIKQAYASPENQAKLKAIGGEEQYFNNLREVTADLNPRERLFNQPQERLEESIARGLSNTTLGRYAVPAEDGTRRPFIAGADGKNVAGDYIAGGRYSSARAGTDSSLNLNYAQQLQKTSGQSLDSVEQMKISNPIANGIDWPELPKSPVPQLADAAQDIKDRNTEINSLLDTGDFPTPPPKPSPSPTPVAQRKDEEIYA